MIHTKSTLSLFTFIADFIFVFSRLIRVFSCLILALSYELV